MESSTYQFNLMERGLPTNCLVYFQQNTKEKKKNETEKCKEKFEKSVHQIVFFEQEGIK